MKEIIAIFSAYTNGGKKKYCFGTGKQFFIQ
jgi:hypothetical protein